MVEKADRYACLHYLENHGLRLTKCKISELHSSLLVHFVRTGYDKELQRPFRISMTVKEADKIDLAAYCMLEMRDNALYEVAAEIRHDGTHNSINTG